MSKSVKWLSRHPRVFAWVALPLFPALAVVAFFDYVRPSLIDLWDDFKDGVPLTWGLLIEAYKEWPGNIYEEAESVRRIAEKRGAK